MVCASAMGILSAILSVRVPGAAFVAMGLVWGSFAAYVPVLKARVGAGDGLFGLLIMASAVGLLTAMWLAPAADRRFGRRALPAAVLAMGLAATVPATATGPVTFGLGMAGLGLASGLTDVLMNTRVSEIESARGRPLMSAAHGVFSLGYLAAALAAAAARSAELSPGLAFLAVALVLAALAPVAGMVRAAPGAPAADVPAGGPVPLAVIVCGIVTFAAFSGEGGMEVWSALHLERTLGASAGQGAAGPALLGLAMAVGRFSGQAMAELLGERRLLSAAGLLGAGGALCVALAPSLPVAYAGFAAMALGVSVIAPLALGLAGRSVPPARRGRAIAAASVIGFGGFLIGPPGMGMISEIAGLRAAFATLGLVLALVPLLTTLGLRDVARPADLA